MIEVPDIEFCGCKLFIDSDEPEIAEAMRDNIKKMFDEMYHKPDWYYRAKAKEALGIG